MATETAIITICDKCGMPVRVDFVDGKVVEVYRLCRCYDGKDTD